MQEFLSNIGTKSYILCCDVNINLVNSTSHKQNQDFVDILAGLGLYSLINLPTRITTNSSTLIDIIFTNISEYCTNGVLIDDTVSDHLPIFTCVKMKNTKASHKNEYKFIRCMADRNYENFIDELKQLSWNDLYHISYVNEAYDKFIVTLKELYDKHFPMKQIKVNGKKCIKPWFTKGLIKCCKRKNKLYKSFVKNKSIEREQKYKHYKNKLTKVLRHCEKQYYSNTLKECSNNVQKTWKVLNEIIKKQRCSAVNVETFIDKYGRNINNKLDVADGFNDCFVNIGPKLAGNIDFCNYDASVLDYLDSRNDTSMFLEPVVEQEVLDIVNKCANKTSLDCEENNLECIEAVYLYM